jgi:hypothetical protein
MRRTFSSNQLLASDRRSPFAKISTAMIVLLSCTTLISVAPAADAGGRAAVAGQTEDQRQYSRRLGLRRASTVHRAILSPAGLERSHAAGGLCLCLHQARNCNLSDAVIGSRTIDTAEQRGSRECFSTFAPHVVIAR